MVEIRRCKSEEIDGVMQFIDTHWQRGHVLATHKGLVDWQYRDKDGSYNILIAQDEGNILGVLAYIPTRHYDPEIGSDNVLWLSLWRVQDDCRAERLGLRMLQALETIEPCCAIGGNAINAAHPPIYKAFGYDVFDLTQHYMVNKNMPQKILAAGAHPAPNKGDAACVAWNDEDVVSHALPVKTKTFFTQRFLKHPFYNYRIFTLSNTRHRGIIVARVASHAESKVLRIVDFVGDTEIWAQAGNALQKLMDEMGAEYMDFWQYGISEAHMQQAGFGKVDALGSVIVPNYFEPFVKQNTRMICVFKSALKTPLIICRADGDQDRPNQLAAS